MITIASIVDSVIYDTLDLSNSKVYSSYFYLSTSDYGKNWNWELIKDLKEPFGLTIINDSLAFVKTRFVEDSLNIHYFLNKSVDNLKTWKVVLETPVSTNTMTPQTLKQLEKGKCIINGLQGDLFITKDFGDTWELIIDDFYPYVNTGLLHPSEKDYYLTTMKAGLYKSRPNIFDFITDVEEKVEVIENNAPKIWLYEPYPNPVINNLTFEMIWLKSINSSDIKLEIADLRGNFIKDISNEPRNYILENKAQISINVANLNSGVYYVCASIKDYKRTIPFVVVK